MRARIVRALACSPLLTWPALYLVEELPPDHPLDGKADDFATGAVVALLLLGLLAAGWLRPLWVVVPAVLAFGTAVPHAYEALHPTVCPPGVDGMDCLPASFGALWFAALVEVVIVLGWLVRVGCGAPAVDLLPGRRRLGSPAA